MILLEETKNRGLFSFFLTIHEEGGPCREETADCLEGNEEATCFLCTCLCAAGVSLILAVLYSSLKNNINVNGSITGRLYFHVSQVHGLDYSEDPRAQHL